MSSGRRGAREYRPLSEKKQSINSYTPRVVADSQRQIAAQQLQTQTEGRPSARTSVAAAYQQHSLVPAADDWQEGTYGLHPSTSFTAVGVLDYLQTPAAPQPIRTTAVHDTDHSAHRPAVTQHTTVVNQTERPPAEVPYNSKGDSAETKPPVEIDTHKKTTKDKTLTIEEINRLQRESLFEALHAYFNIRDDEFEAEMQAADDAYRAEKVPAIKKETTLKFYICKAILDACRTNNSKYLLSILQELKDKEFALDLAFWVVQQHLKLITNLSPDFQLDIQSNKSLREFQKKLIGPLFASPGLARKADDSKQDMPSGEAANYGLKAAKKTMAWDSILCYLLQIAAGQSVKKTEKTVAKKGDEQKGEKEEKEYELALTIAVDQYYPPDGSKSQIDAHLHDSYKKVITQILLNYISSRRKLFVGEDLYQDPIMAKLLYRASVNDSNFFLRLLNKIERQFGVTEDLNHHSFSEQLTNIILSPIRKLIAPAELEAANRGFINDLGTALLESLKKKEYYRAQKIIAFVDSIYEFQLAILKGDLLSMGLEAVRNTGLERCRAMPGNYPVGRAGYSAFAFLVGAATLGAITYFIPFVLAGEEVTVSMSGIITALMSSSTGGYSARRVCNDWLEKNKRGDTTLTQNVNHFFNAKIAAKAAEEAYKQFNESILVTIAEKEEAILGGKEPKKTH